MYKNIYLLVLLSIICLITNGCKKESDKIPVTNEISVNYQTRNKVFEKFAFDKNEFEKIFFSINQGNGVFLNSERIKVNPFCFSDSDITKSKIKTIIETEYKFSFGKQDDYGLRKYLIKYNKSGKSVEDNMYNISHLTKDKYYPSRIIYEYDPDSIIYKIFIFNPYKKPLSVIRYEYDNYFNLVTKIKENLYIENIPEIKIEKDNKTRKRFSLSPTLYAESFRFKSEDFNNTFKNVIIDADFNFSYKYDTLGKKIEMIEWFKSGSINKKEIYSYDSLENIIEINYYGWNYKKNIVEKVRHITFFQNKFEIFDYDLDGKIKYQTTYKFDDNFNLIEANEFNEQFKINYKILYSYNNKNKETKRLFYKGEYLDRKIISIIDDKDQLVTKEIFSGDSEIVYKIKYQYNITGLVSEELTLNNKDEQLNKVFFKYNENNNIQEFIEYDNINEPVKLVSFVYEYYN